MLTKFEIKLLNDGLQISFHDLPDIYFHDLPDIYFHDLPDMYFKYNKIRTIKMLDAGEKFELYFS